MNGDESESSDLHEVTDYKPTPQFTSQKQTRLSSSSNVKPKHSLNYQKEDEHLRRSSRKHPGQTMNTAADQVNSSELKDTVRALSTVDENYMKLIEMQQDFINSSSKEQLIKNIESSAPK